MKRPARISKFKKNNSTKNENITKSGLHKWIKIHDTTLKLSNKLKLSISVPKKFATKLRSIFVNLNMKQKSWHESDRILRRQSGQILSQENEQTLRHMSQIILICRRSAIRTCDKSDRNLKQNCSDILTRAQYQTEPDIQTWDWSEIQPLDLWDYEIEQITPKTAWSRKKLVCYADTRLFSYPNKGLTDSALDWSDVQT